MAKFIGYDDFNPQSWPSDCAPNKEAWNVYDRPGNGYPQEFWNCADITIEGACMSEWISGGPEGIGSSPCPTDHDNP